MFPRWRFGQNFAFNLENGGDQLAPFFPHVSLHRYDDVLVVTEAEPLVAFLQSLGPRTSALTGDARAALLKYIEDYIARHGAIRLTRESGLFETWD